MSKVTIALSAVIAAALSVLVVTPAQATGGTTLSFNVASSSSYLDDVELMVDGNSDPAFTKSISGCRADFRDGVLDQSYTITDLANSRLYLYNAKAIPVTYTERFYEGSDCSGIDFATTPTASASITLNPELKIPTVTLAANTERTDPVPFTTYAWNFGYGSSFALATPHDCDPSSTLTGALPNGITISETAYGNGVTPQLYLHGTPSTAGTYVVCAKLSLGYGQQYAWMHINVGGGSQLASTGRDNRVILFTGLGSLGVVALAILGVWLSTRRRRS